MSDFMDKIISIRKNGNAQGESSNTNCLFLYQTHECYQLLEECMLCEGMETPESILSGNQMIPDLLSGKEHPLIFIEITDDLLDMALKLPRLISHQARVVLIGRVDSISAHRTLEELGFYYLFWPADKNDICSFLKSLQDDESRNKGPQQARAAMRIATVALKGGSGSTMISCELAYALSSETGQEVIIADHGYTSSNMHIMLGKKDLVRRPIGDEGIRHHTLTNMLDPVGVQSQLVRIERGINYLGFESMNSNADEMREYTHNMLGTLLRSANFIIEDYSGSVKFYPDPKWLCPITDCVVLVTLPTLSALHETRNFLKQFDAAQETAEHKTRLILVLNHVAPSSNIDQKAIEQFLERPVEIEFPYQKKTEELLTSGKRFIDSKTGLTMPFQHLARQILGKPVEEKIPLVARLQELKDRFLPMVARKRKFEPGVSDAEEHEADEITADDAEVTEQVVEQDQPAQKKVTVIQAFKRKEPEKPETLTID